jgi:methionyl-tRNA synthetase
VQKVNSDLVGKVVNIASRCAGFIHKGNPGVMVAAMPRRNCRSLPGCRAEHRRRL